MPRFSRGLLASVDFFQLSSRVDLDSSVTRSWRVAAGGDDRVSKVPEGAVSAG